MAPEQGLKGATGARAFWENPTLLDANLTILADGVPVHVAPSAVVSQRAVRLVRLALNDSMRAPLHLLLAPNRRQRLQILCAVVARNQRRDLPSERLGKTFFPLPTECDPGSLEDARLSPRSSCPPRTCRPDRHPQRQR